MKKFVERVMAAIKVLVFKESTACIYMTPDTAMHLAFYLGQTFHTDCDSDKIYFMGYEVRIINSNMIIMGKDAKIYDSKD